MLIRKADAETEAGVLPTPEFKELIAGYTLIEVRSKAEAVEWARRWPAIDADAEIEVRQLFAREDFAGR